MYHTIFSLDNLNIIRIEFPLFCRNSPLLSLCLSQRVNQVQKESEDTPAVLVDPYVFTFLFIDIYIQVIRNAYDLDLGISYQTCGKVSENNSGYRTQLRTFFFTCF